SSTAFLSHSLTRQRPVSRSATRASPRSSAPITASTAARVSASTLLLERDWRRSNAASISGCSADREAVEGTAGGAAAAAGPADGVELLIWGRHGACGGPSPSSVGTIR